MVENIVFDLGNVLLDFKPQEYLENNYSDPKLREEIYQKLFLSSEWVALDRGTLTREEAVKQLGSQYPELKSEIKRVLSSLDSLLQAKEETIALLDSLAKTEYNLYVLSNFHLQAHQEMVAKHDFFDHFKGQVISAKVNYIKPEAEIYRHLLDKYDLEPTETVFIDDSRENLTGAEEFGIKTIHFQGNVERLKKKLVELKIL